MDVANKVSALNTQQSTQWVTESSNPSSEVQNSCAVENTQNTMNPPVFGTEPAIFLSIIPNRLSCPKRLDGLRAEEIPRIPSDQLELDSWNEPTLKWWIKRTLRRDCSLIENFLGQIYVNSTSKLLQPSDSDDQTICYGHDQVESQTSITIHPATWLIRFGFRYGLRLDILRSSLQGWKQRLNAICLVPDKAPIFLFCSDGNLSAVRSLLSSGYASARDTSPEGLTPLHVS